MNPGRELDALIAEKVMGLDPKWFNFDQSYYELSDAGPRLKRYSHDISAAAVVKERVFGLGHAWIIVKKIRSDGRYTAFPDSEDSPDWLVVGDSEPHVICLAALKSIGVEV